MDPAPRLTVPAPEAHRLARKGEGVIGWLLDPAERDALLLRFPPRYSRTDADHVTLVNNVSDDSPLPEETAGEIVGHSDDGAGVEALVVRIDGTTGRPDGRTYHITWSLIEGRHGRESNKVIREQGWEPIAAPIPITLKPAQLR